MGKYFLFIGSNPVVDLLMMMPLNGPRAYSNKSQSDLKMQCNCRLQVAVDLQYGPINPYAIQLP